jgi:Flp pilus assembly protein TadG
MRRPGRGRILVAGPDPRTCGNEADNGMVTAELAVALPALVVVMVAALYGVAVVTAQLRCEDAAAMAARLAARGETPAIVRSSALAAAPSGAGLSLASSATTVTATVTVRVSAPGLAGLLPGVSISSRAADDLQSSGALP